MMMIKPKYALLATAALALPSLAWAARSGDAQRPVLPVSRPAPAARPIVIDLLAPPVSMTPAFVPPAFVPPAFVPRVTQVALPDPAALIRQVDLMQSRMLAEMSAMQRLVPQPMFAAWPTASAPDSTALAAYPAGVAVCSEQIQLVPRPGGRTAVLIRRTGNACGPMPTGFTGAAPAAMPSPMQAPMQRPAQAQDPHRPPGALPAPSKLILAKYPVPQPSAQSPQQG